MKININGKDIKFFEEDDNETFRMRIASSFATIPDYVKSVTISDARKYHIIPILIDIIKGDIKNESFSEFLSKNNILEDFIGESINTEEILERNKIKKKIENIFKTWIQYVNPGMTENIGGFEHVKYEPIEKELLEQFDISIRISDFINHDYIEFQREYTKKVQENKNFDDTNVKFYEKLQETEGIEPFSFMKESSTVQFKTKISKKDVSLDNIFSNLRCTENALMISYRDMFKLNQENTFPDSWILEASGVREFDIILLKQKLRMVKKNSK
jgi:hypothetical protein